jgi:hypothetical protein
MTVDDIAVAQGRSQAVDLLECGDRFLGRIAAVEAGAWRGLGGVPLEVLKRYISAQENPS